MRPAFALFALWVSLFSSCLDLLPVDESTVEERLAAYAFINTSDTVSTIMVERTLGFDEIIREDQAHLEGAAAVALLRNGVPAGTFQQLGDSVFYKGAHPRLDDPSASYEMVISHPDFGEIRAGSVYPRQVETVMAQIHDSLYLDNGQVVRSAIEVIFTDPPASGDFYEIGFYRILENNPQDIRIALDFVVRQVAANGENVDNFQVLQYFSAQSSLFKDEKINGRQVRMILDPQTFISSSYSYFLVFRNITEAHFDYLAFLDADANGLPRELQLYPTVFSNFDGGLGIFTLYHETVLEVE